MSENKDTDPTAGERVWFVDDEDAHMTNDDAVIAGASVGETSEDVPADPRLDGEEITQVVEAVEAVEAVETVEADEAEETRVRRQSLLTLAEPAADAAHTEATSDTSESTSVAAEETSVLAPVATEEAKQTRAPEPGPAPAPVATTPPPAVAASAPPATRNQAHARQLDQSIFEGATQLPSVPSRAAAHLWSLLLTFLLLPVALFFAADGVTRAFPEATTKLPGSIVNWAGIAEIGLAALATFLLILLARWSSLGAFVWGTAVAIIGIAGIAALPQLAPLVNPTLADLRAFNAFGGNVTHHLVALVPTGLLALTGIALIALGFVSHGARRAGRRDYVARNTVEQMEQ